MKRASAASDDLEAELDHRIGVRLAVLRPTSPGCVQFADILYTYAGMGRRIAVRTFALILFSTHVVGADLFYMDHDPFTDRYVGPIGPLVISGEIMPGDYDQLLSKITADESRFLALNKVILASDGGDVAEALKIAGLIKSLYSEVIVGTLTGRCVSACFFIYAAASQREVNGERLLGINRPYIPDAEEASPPPDAATVESRALMQVRGFLRENRVPAYLVDEMFRRASDDAYWLSADDQKKLGFRSQSFNQFLAVKCAWSDQIERETFSGERSIDGLKQMMRCRDRATQEAARQALVLARSDKSVRDPHQTIKRAELKSRQGDALTGGPAESVPPKPSSE
jgi:hypothetical protein